MSENAVDPSNPIVQLCIEGMAAETDGRPEEARELFHKAWELSTDDYDACVAAHFVARHQNSPENTLYWNQVALERAEKVDDERVTGFYPSLYLNMGYSHEVAGNVDKARRYYELALERANLLSDDRYGDTVRYGIAEGFRRLEKRADTGDSISATSNQH